MKDDLRTKSLSPAAVDYVASAAKAALGAVPFVGFLLIEIAGTVIPNQRIERIVKFAEALERKLSRLEEQFVRTQLKEEGFTDLIEEGLRQAARSLSDSRREYIASIIANSLSFEDIEYQESRYLLRILSEINDVEVIWLHFHMISNEQEEEFRERHKALLEPVATDENSSQDIVKKSSLRYSYRGHLAALGLLEAAYDIDPITKQPEFFDSDRGAPNVRGYKITALGRLLSQHIGLQEQHNAP